MEYESISVESIHIPAEGGANVAGENKAIKCITRYIILGQVDNI